MRNDGTVNSGPKADSRLASETGSGSVTSGFIAGTPVYSPANSQHSRSATALRRRQATIIMAACPIHPSRGWLVPQ